MSGWWWAQSHVGFANKLRQDMLARLGGGGLSFYKRIRVNFFKIPFSRFALASAR